MNARIGLVALLLSAAALNGCSSCNCTGPAGPVGPVGPTASPSSLPTPIPDLLAFSTIVLEANQPTAQVTVVDVGDAGAPRIVARLLGPACPPLAGSSSGQAGIDALGDVIAGVTCYEDSDPPSGSLVVYPRTSAGYGNPIVLAQAAVAGVAVNGSVLDYVTLGSPDPIASLSIAAWAPPSTMTSLTSVPLDNTLLGYEQVGMTIGSGGVYIARLDETVGPSGVTVVSPNGAGGAASSFTAVLSRGLAIDSSNDVWSLETPVGGTEGTTTLVVRSAAGAILNTEAIVPRGLPYAFGIQFDRAGNLWLAAQNTTAATTNGAGSTTIYGYLNPSATAAQLPAPVTSFSLANSVEYIQAKARRR